MLALMMVMMWPYIPMFLIEVHFATGFWRRLGFWTFFVVGLEWLPIAVVVYLLQDAVLATEIALVLPFVALGFALISAGVLLHLWTAKLLGLKATLGYPELKSSADDEKRRIITSGPFGVVRHPSYWAHTMIIVGVFLITGVAVVGAIAVVDFLIAYFVTTTLEERELIGAVGEEYREYQKKVPKFFPKLGKAKI